MSHNVNNIGHLHTIDITIKSELEDTGSSGTHTRLYDTHENTQKRSHTIFVSSACGNKLPSNIACTLAFPRFPSEGREANLLPDL